MKTFDTSRAILVWAFEDAPEELRALSNNGGDEDWLALVPMDYGTDYVSWIESGPFGCCGVDKIETEFGLVFIGSHA